MRKLGLILLASLPLSGVSLASEWRESEQDYQIRAYLSNQMILKGTAERSAQIQYEIIVERQGIEKAQWEEMQEEIRKRERKQVESAKSESQKVLTPTQEPSDEGKKSQSLK